MEKNVKRNVRCRVKRRKSDTSNASIPHIPEEIQIEILSWLPPKSLSRFKRVSKHWNDTLTIRAFLLNHSRSYDKHPKLCFVKRSTHWAKGSVISYKLNSDNTPKTTTMIPIVTRPEKSDYCIRGQDLYLTFNIFMNKYLRISNICNDLICVFSMSSSNYVSLLNLKTGDLIRLPAITMTSGEHCTYLYALGFDPVHKVFKVLGRIYSRRGIDSAILTVGSKYWKPIDTKSLHRYRSMINKSDDSVCLNGVIYWANEIIIDGVIRKGKTIDDVMIAETVVAFDLNREAFRDNELVSTTPVRLGTYKGYYLTCLKDRPTLLIWKKKIGATEEVEQWTLFNHKTPNATWKSRNLTNMMVPYAACRGTLAGGSTFLRHSHRIKYSKDSWYFSYDLEKFAIE